MALLKSEEDNLSQVKSGTNVSPKLTHNSCLIYLRPMSVADFIRSVITNWYFVTKAILYHKMWTGYQIQLNKTEI